MNRAGIIRSLILDEICDDYENIDQTIFGNVSAASAHLGITVTRADVVETLRGLASDGLAKAYHLSPREPFVTELQHFPSCDIETDFRTYFFITQEGLCRYLEEGECPNHAS